MKNYTKFIIFSYTLSALLVFRGKLKQIKGD